MGINTNRWNRLRYTLYAPLYGRVATFRRPRRRSIGLLELQPGERVLVDGAGTGADLDFIPTGVEVVATDLTPAMVERIGSRAEQLGLQVDARVMDAHALEFRDASFDAVILHLIVAVVPDPVLVLRETAGCFGPEAASSSSPSSSLRGFSVPLPVWPESGRQRALHRHYPNSRPIAGGNWPDDHVPRARAARRRVRDRGAAKGVGRLTTSPTRRDGSRSAGEYLTRWECPRSG